MDETSHGSESVVEQLEFVEGDGQWFFGLHGGYLVAVRGDFDSPRPNPPHLPRFAPGAPALSGLTFQIRHVLQGTDVPDPDAVEWTERLDGLREERAIDIVLDDRIAWFDIDKLDKIPHGVTPVDLLDEVLVCLDDAGIHGTGTTCHYCGQRDVEHSTFVNGRVAQICPECATERLESATQIAMTGRGVRLCIAWGSMAALLGGLLWGGAWIAFDTIVVAVSGGTGLVMVSDVAILLIGLCFALAAMGPTVLLLRRIPARGDRIAGFIALGSVLAGLAVGEVIHATWIVYTIAGVMAPVQAIVRLPLIWGFSPPAYLVMKLLGSTGALFAAYLTARPKRKTLVL